jgi:hypothetical protein
MPGPRVLKLLRRTGIKPASSARDSCEMVFNTYELLESVLLYLDAPALRRARLVAKSWEHVIANSSIMQATLRKTQGRYARQYNLLLVGDGGCGRTAFLDQVCVSQRSTEAWYVPGADSILGSPMDGFQTRMTRHGTEVIASRYW